MARASRLLFLLALLPLLLLSFQSGTSPQGSAATPPVQAAPEEEISFRILLGLTDTKPTPWDGTLVVSPGSVVRLEPWRFDEEDRLEGTSGWKISTHGVRVFGAAAERPVAANGVVATFSKLVDASEVRVDTTQGKFQFRPGDIPYGASAKFLDGRVMVDRVPASTQVSRSREDQDYPAAAVDQAGNLWIAYLQFTPNAKFTGVRLGIQEAPTNLAELAEPTGGDQILLARYSDGKWAEPVSVSETRGDLYKPAVAVDGSSRVWVFWSANTGGNFDLYARAFEAGKPGKTLRLSTDRGADIVPAAATDAQGRVWVAWQAFRNGRSQIRASRQQGTSFADELTVASSAGNEWNPAIAASPKGDVAVAWDSYRKGNYDVYFRTFDGSGRAGTEVPAAASARYEAYPSLAYDESGRLWVAWEESDESWGKDFGAHETTGMALYQGRWIQVKVWQGEQAFVPGNLGVSLPGVPNRMVDATERQGDGFKARQPDPELAKNRAPSRPPQPPPRPLNSYPRLLSDRGGRVWLAYRTAQPIWWTSIGTVWFENVVSFDGASWTLPIFLPHSDNLLDNRPALASTAAGELLIVRSSDGRQQFDQSLRNVYGATQQFATFDDRYNNDLYASRVVLAEKVKPAKLESAERESAPAAAEPEDGHVRRLRDYRARINGVDYRILRGEFHRHTEISMDAARDGSIWDAWRYALDAAALDWLGCCDHDNGFGREYSWWITQKQTDIFFQPGVFTPMFNYERSVAYPEGHRNIIFAQRGVRTLPRLPKVSDDSTGSAPDTQMLYKYLRHFNGIVAVHTSATNMGTDWRDNDPRTEPIVEIYQALRQNYEMPQAPRSNSEQDSIGGWRPKGFVSLALEKGYKLGFQASSDHVSTHMSYCNVIVSAPTREAVLEAFQKRHVYAATDDILADLRSGNHIMGDEFETPDWPSLKLKLVGTAPFAKVHVIKDNRFVYTTEPKTATVDLTWRDTAAETGKTSYYYVRGEQTDGEMVWVSPMWITYRGKRGTQ
jgi:Protein of unknown function (DUF3604)